MTVHIISWLRYLIDCSKAIEQTFAPARLLGLTAVYEWTVLYICTMTGFTAAAVEPGTEQLSYGQSKAVASHRG